MSRGGKASVNGSSAGSGRLFLRDAKPTHVNARGECLFLKRRVQASIASPRNLPPAQTSLLQADDLDVAGARSGDSTPS